MTPGHHSQERILAVLRTEGRPLTAGTIWQRLPRSGRPSRGSVAAHLRSLRTQELVEFAPSNRWKGGKWWLREGGSSSETAANERYEAHMEREWQEHAEWCATDLEQLFDA